MSNSVLADALKGLVLGALTWMVSVPLLASSASATDALHQGFDWYQKQQFAESLAAYQQANAKRPEFEALLGVGSAAYRLEDSILAVEAFKQAAIVAKASSQRAQALFNLGNSYMQLQAADYAVEAYQQALLYQPDFAQAQHNLAIAQQQMTQMRQQRNGRNGEGEQGESGQGQGAGEREGKLNLDQNFIGGAGENNDSGESPEDQTLLPQQRHLTNRALSTKTAQVQLNATSQQIEQVHQQTASRQQAQKFLLELQDKDLNQQLLLKRLLEREAGFYADQSEPHEIPGVAPW